MQCLCRQMRKNPVRAETHPLNRLVIGQHGEHGVVLAGLGDGFGCPGAKLDQRVTRMVAKYPIETGKAAGGGALAGF